MERKKSGFFLKNLPFRTLIAASLVAISCFMAIYMGIFSMRLTSSMIEVMSRHLSENSVDFTRNLLDRAFSDAQDTLTRIIRLTAVQDAVSSHDVTKEEAAQLAARVAAAVRPVLYTGAGLDGAPFAMVNVYFKNGVAYSTLQYNPLPFDSYAGSRAYFTDMDILPVSGYAHAAWCGALRLRDNVGREVSSILGIRMLYESVTMEERGMMVYALDESLLYDRYSAVSKNAMLMLKDGTIVSGADKRQLGQPLDGVLHKQILLSGLPSGSLSYRENGETNIVSYKKVAGNDIYFIAPFDYDTELSRAETSGFIRSMLLIAAGGVMISVLVTVLISRMLSTSVLSLKKVVGKVYDGDMDARFVGANIAEISYLGERVNDMLESIKGFFEIQKADSQAKRDLELRLMQSQINPHLLYNTLDSVLWALQHNKTELVEELVSSMSSFFKITLSGGSPQIPLENELALIKSYLTIQRLARNQQITLETDIPSWLLRYPVNKLTLQPIVENAIKHGFSGYRDDGLITITARAEGEHLRLTVEDNGIGILPEELGDLNALLRAYPPVPGQKHFGLYNINHRIIGHGAGEGFGVTVNSQVGEYTRVTVDMPFFDPWLSSEGGESDHA